MAIQLTSTDALIVVDVQYDFLPGGSLAVPDGNAVIPVINRLAARFAHVILTQDWHPADHISFASNHSGQIPFCVIPLSYGPQVLWPDHCIWDTQGAEISAELDIPQAELIIRKGYNQQVDSYSAFQEADRSTRTGLGGYLRERGITRIFAAGLATDFCVGWTALDGVAAGFDVTVIEDATRAIDADGSLAKAWARMEMAGVKRIDSAVILDA